MFEIWLEGELVGSVIGTDADAAEAVMNLKRQFDLDYWYCEVPPNDNNRE